MTLLPLIAAAHASGGQGLAEHLPVALVLPFVGLLLCIALLPMVASHFWESNLRKLGVALAWSAPVAGWFLYQVAATDLGHTAGTTLVAALEEYLSFIVLLGSLFTISGGIFLSGDLRGTPRVNTAFLALGAVLANLVGTTGASMLLIRPVLRTNQQRKYVQHIPIFFIFLVSNIGGALTPIGDPPLFLGYLRGVSFWWPLVHVWPIWLFAVSVLLALFFALDTWFYRKEPTASLAEDASHVDPLKIFGGRNLLLLLGVVLCVLFLSPSGSGHDFRDYFAREIGMVILAAVSLGVTPTGIRERNQFTWGPILEVAALFIGIFVTMLPATLLLEANGASLGVSEPWQYFWASGSLSSFLDNAPTYVTFAALACGTVPSCPSAEELGSLTTGVGLPLLLAISCGSVFMGANSYIGNGPNFMVRAIAEESGYKMPSFFGYMAWSVGILIPLFLVITLLFFV